MKSSLLAAVTIVVAAVTIVAFGPHSSHAATYHLSGALDVLQAGTNGSFGSGTGNGTGTVSGSYDDVADLLDYTITWQDLIAPGTVTNMHFHNALPGFPGGVDLGVPANSGADWISPIMRTGVAVNPDQEANLLGGRWYLNIHTTNFTSGEIRGQVTATLVPEPATAGLAALACLSAVSLHRRKR